MKENFYHINPDLLVKYLLEEASPQEKALTEQWIAASDDHRKQFDDFKLIWETSKQLAASTQVDEEDSWQRFRQRIHAPAKQPAIVRPLYRGMSLARIAAIVVLVIGVGALAALLFPANKNMELQSHHTVLRDTLPDGSVITLNKNSRLGYPQRFTGGARNITLQGEAFFNVAPDKQKPFIIHVNDVTVKVLGTSFNIRSSQGRTEVIVETGIVQVSRQQYTVELHPKEQLSAAPGDAALAKQPVTDKLYNYYRSREFVCDSTPLWKLVQVLQEAYGVNIVIERKELRNLLLTATFKDESPDTILAVIKKTFNITIEKSANRVVLK